MIDRILGIAFIIVATMVPPDYFLVMTYPEVQLVVGTAIVIYILVGDALAGFLFGAAVLIMYFQAYAFKFGISWKDLIFGKNMGYNGRPKNYITQEDLDRAQSNVVDPMNYNIEIKGMEGSYGEEVYGAQGMDHELPGRDTELRWQPLENSMY